MTTPPPSDDVLVRYLLGRLPEAEAEALDERSVSDDGVAVRLEDAENDLVDRYVRGELADSDRAAFETHYLRGARGPQKVAFARALLSKTMTPHSATQAAARAWRTWALAAAAVVVVGAGGILLVEQARDPVVEEPPQVSTPKYPEPAAPPAGSTVVESLPAPPPVVVAFALPPARRGIAQPPIISVPSGATEVLLRLQLEGDDFSEYAAVVKDVASGRIIHQESRLRSRAFAGGRIVSVTVHASSLPATHYIVELSGHASGEPAEPLSTYPFRVAAR